MDVFDLRNRLIAEYAQYVRSFITIRDERIAAEVNGQLDRGALWPEPLIQLNPAFEPGEALESLVGRGVLHEECLRIFRRKPRPEVDQGLLRLHRHQVESIEAARAGENYVLTTGTGSGKSLAYLVPIVDHVLRRGSGRGIQAIVVYPMNALANSQEGELGKFLRHGYGEGRQSVTFRRYTGQEKREERDEVIARPPDILLTNYVMLELLLTRPIERALIAAAAGLRFLVLDELHTYRGRQGADVAMLVRRVREACQATDVIHVGTSATLRPSEGTWREARAEVAAVATRLFGAPVRPERVIGETLRRTTPLFRPEAGPALRARLETSPPPGWRDLDELRRDPLSSWIESTLGLREEDGRLIRTEPRPLRGPDGAAESLAAATGLPVEPCEVALRAALLAGYRLRDAADRPAFAFRLHQFISKGESVYATLEPEDVRHVTLQAQQFAPGSERQKVLLPLAFCRECGQEYYVVRRHEDGAGGVEYLPRELSDRRHTPEGEAGFLFVDTLEPWPAEDDLDALRQRLPESWLETDGDRVRIRDARRDRLPRRALVSPSGCEDRSAAAALDARWFRAPFLLCLRCRVDYQAYQRSDFGKLATLGSEGRSSATTVLSMSALRELRAGSGLDRAAQKLLSFTDNRQDASLQAGHFNDFIEVSLIRAALYRAARDAGPDGLRHDELATRAFAALALPLEVYAQKPDVRYAALDDTRRALRLVLAHYLYRDLRRGWRVTSPNLEQSGLLHIDYVSLGDLVRDEPAWRGLHPALAGATPEQREAACRVLLDHLRRELVIRVDALEPEQHERLKSLSDQYLKEPWAVEPEARLERSCIAFPPTAFERRAPTPLAVYLSERGGFARYLCRTTTFPGRDAAPKADDARRMIGELLEVLRVPDILGHARLPGARPDEPPGYQLNASAIIWRAGDGQRAFHDPVRVPNEPATGLRTNPFFVGLYQGRTTDLSGLEGREHTAQVPADVRQEREDRFRAGALPVLFCSPTMELGVDIAELNVVNLRNVPPTPANYAQRSGRAGRGGQPALVYAYCSSGSPHDQYFFRRPSRMVAGSVAPPRLDLANEDLARAHVHAIWASEVGLDLQSSLADVLDVDTDTPTLAVRPRIAEKLHDLAGRENALRRAREALGAAVQELLESSADGPVDVDAWLRAVLDRIPASFEEACARWRGLYLAALEQARRQQRIILDPSRDANARKGAERLRAEAVSQLDLLLDREGSPNSDFYSYRYFASEGFLPGYSFPRLPLSAYLPARRQTKGLPSFLSRPRFLAITEFGPRSFIYHEGSRYQISKVILPVEGEERSFTRSAAQCTACGYLHPLSDDPAPDLCERCHVALPLPVGNLFLMQNVATRRRDRINSDEEERLRLGYEVRTGVRFAERDGVRLVREAVLRDERGEPLARFHYGHAAAIWRLNLGERRRQHQERRGYVLDLERGHWVRDPGDDDDDDAAAAADDAPPNGAARPAPSARRDEQPSSRTARVIPFVQDHRNCLLLEPAEALPEGVMASLQAALKAAIQVHFQLEDNELAAEPLPDEGDRRLILFYEAAEGGAGALRRLVDPREHRTLAEVARLALDLCHFDPDSLADRDHGPRAAERCEAACYDCLLSYFNQRDHRQLDRLSIRDLLARWRRGVVESTVDSGAGGSTRRAHQPPGPDGDPEPDPGPRPAPGAGRFLAALERLGLRRPSDADVAVAGVRADFLYRREGLAVFVDAPLDPDAEERLSDDGVTAVRFGPDESAWPSLFARYRGVFGEPRPASAAPLDLELFEPRFHALLARLAATPGVSVDGGADVDRDGRVVGTTVAAATRGERTVHLVDDADETAASLVAALAERGETGVRVGVAPEAAVAVLQALSTTPATSTPGS